MIDGRTRMFLANIERPRERANKEERENKKINYDGEKEGRNREKAARLVSVRRQLRGRTTFFSLPISIIFRTFFRKFT